MKKKDIAAFIEEMESIGDEWTPEQVEKCNSDLNAYLIHMLYERPQL